MGFESKMGFESLKWLRVGLRACVRGGKAAEERQQSRNRGGGGVRGGREWEERNWGSGRREGDQRER
jgi:hypothetical protein